MTQRWLEQRERSQAWALATIVWIALHVGRRAARALLYPISLYFLVFSLRSRAASAAYLARVLGRRPRLAERFRHHHTFAATLLDRVFLLAGRAGEFEIAVHGDALVAELAERRQGSLLLGGHFGSFEIMRATAWAKPHVRLYFAMHEDNARKMNAALRAVSPDLPDRLIPLGQPGTMLRVQEAVAEGAFVGFLADRLVRGDRFVVHPFLGERAPFPSGAFRLAAALQCPVLTMFGVYRGGRRYEIYFEPLAGPAPLEPRDREAWVAETMARYAERLEGRCHDAPYNWFNFYAFWDLPPAERA